MLVSRGFSRGSIQSQMQRSPTVAALEMVTENALLQRQLTTYHRAIGLHETFVVRPVQPVVSLHRTRRYSAQNDAGPPFPHSYQELVFVLRLLSTPSLSTSIDYSSEATIVKGHRPDSSFSADL